METKPGPKTTEFWVVILTALLNVLNITGAWDFVPNGISVYAMAILGAFYAVGRGLAKLNVKPGP